MKKRIQLLMLCFLSFIIVKAQNPNVGINTEDPTNTLHIKSDGDPLRLEGLQKEEDLSGLSLLLSTEGNEGGVVKKFPLKREYVVELEGGKNYNGNTLSSIKEDQPVSAGLKLKDPKYDNRGYNTFTGIYEFKESGLYFVDSLLSLAVKNDDEDIFDGNFGRFRVMLELRKADGQTTISRLNVNSVNIYKGSKGLDKGYAGYPLYNTATFWAKKGEKLYFLYKIAGLNKMSGNLRNIILLKNSSYLKLIRLL